MSHMATPLHQCVIICLSITALLVTMPRVTGQSPAKLSPYPFGGRNSVHMPVNESDRWKYLGYPSRSIQNPELDLLMQRDVGKEFLANHPENPLPYLITDLFDQFVGALLKAERNKAMGNLVDGGKSQVFSGPITWPFRR